MLPLPLAMRCAGGLGRLAYRMLGPTRRRFEEAIVSWGEYLGERGQEQDLGLALAENELRWQMRDLLLDRVSDRDLEKYVEIEGRSHLDRALAEGRGVIVLGNHFGAQMQPAHWLVRMGYPLRLYMERPRRISRVLSRHFDIEGPLGQQKLFISRSSGAAESAGSILRAARILKAGMILLMASDVRWSGAHTVRAQFLGREHRFSATWAILAGMSGAAVVPVFCQILPDGKYRVAFEPAWKITSSVMRAEVMEEWVQRALSAIESWVRRDPTNCNEYVRWLEEERKPSRDRQTSAAA
jgi:KDO2-lipid IV(A) lauroyltransferase